jgi:outer membrane protein, heavy metal efflux system
MDFRNRMKRAFTFLTLLALAGSLTRTLAEPADTNVVVITPDYLSQLADEARTNHPALRAADARTAAAAANVNSIRTWEDPMVELGGMAARRDMRADEGDLIYGIEQKLPLFGRPRAARNVAGAELATETADAEYQFQILRRDLAKTAFKAALANQVVVIGEQDLAWLEVMNQTVESKFRAGQATLAQTLQLQNERARRATQLQTERELFKHAQVSLNRFLNRDQLAPWPTFELPPLAGPVVFNSRLIEFALKYEPKTLMMRQRIKQAEAMVDFSRRSRLPEVSVGVEARNYTGDGSFRQGMAVFSMSLPWSNAGKYRSDIQREEARLKATEFELADYQSEVREEVHQLTVRIDAARREALLYRDEIIPRSQSALDSAVAGWESNQGMLRDLLEARRMLLEARLMHVRAVTEQYEMLSELILCCGLGDFNALQMIGAEPDAPLTAPPAP